MVSAAPQTPQAAATAFLVPKISHSHPVTQVTARTPRCAIVKFANAIVESHPTNGYLVVKKFTFGWQAINFTSAPLTAVACTSRDKDLGSSGDVNAVRMK